MKLTEMKQALAAGQIQLTRSLGQNFLHDQNQAPPDRGCGGIVGPTDRVLEIGPGLGPLDGVFACAGTGSKCLPSKRTPAWWIFSASIWPNPAKSSPCSHDDALEYL